MKKFVLFLSLIFYFCSSFGQFQYVDKLEHILSHSELDTGIYHTYPLKTKKDGILINKMPATIATYFQEFIERYGENEFNRIMNLSFYDFKKELHSEKNPLKEFLMRMVYDYNWKGDGLRFRYDGDIYVVTYEHLPKTDKYQLDVLYSRDLNLYKWKGNYKWERVNSKPIPYGFYQQNNPIYRHTISTYDHEKFSIVSKSDFAYDLIGMLVMVDAKNQQVKEHYSHNYYTELFLFIKAPHGFDIRIIPIDKKKVWQFNSDSLPKGETYMGVKDKNTIYLHLRTGKVKQDGGREIPSKKCKFIYNIKTNEKKIIKR